MDLDLIERLAVEHAQLGPPLLQHVIVHTRDWHARADAEWIAARLIPRLVETGTMCETATVPVTLARAAAAVEGNVRANLETLVLSELERQGPANNFAATFAGYFVRDRERYRATLDARPPQAREELGPSLVLRAIAASSDADLQTVRAVALEGYRRSPSRDLAFVLGMSVVSGDTVSHRAEHWKRVDHHIAHLLAVLAWDRLSPSQVVAQVRDALGSAENQIRKVAIAGVLSDVPSAEVPALIVEYLNAWNDEQLDMAVGLGPLLGATLAPHLESWPAALSALHPRVIAKLQACSPIREEAARALAFCGLACSGESQLASAAAPRLNRYAGPVDPFDLSCGSVADGTVALDTTPSNGLESPHYFVREQTAERMRRGRTAGIDESVSRSRSSELVAERERAGELGAWTSDPFGHAEALAWDDSVFVREQALGTRIRCLNLAAVDSALATLDTEADHGARSRSLEALSARAFSVHVREGRRRGGHLSDFLAAVGLGAVARLESASHLRAWARTGPMRSRGLVEYCDLDAPHRRYRAAWPTNSVHVFRVDKLGRHVEVADLRDWANRRSSEAWLLDGSWRVVAATPAFAVFAEQPEPGQSDS